MFKIIILTHGTLAEGFMNAAELITGKQDDVEIYSVLGNSNLDEIKSDLLNSIKKCNDEEVEVLVLSDLMFGTPFNITIDLIDKCSFQHLTGFNLAILLEVLTSRQSDSLSNIMLDIEEKGRASIYNPKNYFMKED